ncbi:hypothetical protein [Ktedonospora formicarum]|uniref:hypothetical protein n=1 Tax=Ktedonospora formicarum TaxID=2778364 RepID=UPI001C6925E3|nr:hypothetical protein [Ktedonospora formicarum]
MITQILRGQNSDLVALQEANDRSNAEKLAAALNMHLIFGESDNTFHLVGDLVAWVPPCATFLGAPGVSLAC